MQEARTRSIQTLNFKPKLKKIINQIKPQLLNDTQHIRYPRNDLRVNDLNWTEIDEIETNSLISLCSVLTEIAGCLKSCQVSVIHIDLSFKLTCNITRLYLMLYIVIQTYEDVTWILFKWRLILNTEQSEIYTSQKIPEEPEHRRNRDESSEYWRSGAQSAGFSAVSNMRERLLL